MTSLLAFLLGGAIGLAIGAYAGFSLCLHGVRVLARKGEITIGDNVGGRYRTD